VIESTSDFAVCSTRVWGTSEYTVAVFLFRIGLVGGLALGFAGCGSEPRVVVGRVHAAGLDAAPVTSSPGVEDTGTVFVDAAIVDAAIVDAAIADSAGEGADSATGESGAIDSCTPPGALHRYGFGDLGAAVIDSAGEADGSIRGDATLAGDGRLRLEGTYDYVHLPKGLLSGLSSVSVMLWVLYDGGPAYVRIFDFGMSSAGEDPPEGTASVGRSYLALSPETGFDPSGLAATMSDDGPGGEVAVASDRSIDDGELHQVVVVFDGTNQSLVLYLDGERIGEALVPFGLATINDANNWLGRSQYDADPYWHGSYDEVRVYGQALSDCQIAAAFAAGPDLP
jgi:Concanavalin A-like lectin/glucanases superfamily